MRRCLPVFLALSIATILQGQIIKGVVLDEQTCGPIDFASVFFSGTFTGTTTNQDGGFELDINKYKYRPLTISAMGYYSLNIPELNPAEPLQVSLKPRIFEIEEVMVSTKSLVRKRRACMHIFRREFIGSTSNARKCYILNEEDITFNYGSDRDTLKAFATNPLRIMNLSLGYDITYYLDRFEYWRKTQTTLYTGDIIFNRELADNKKELVKFKRRRANAYSGSSSHFLRCLWADKLDGSGFFIRRKRNGELLGYEDLVIQDLHGRKFLVCNEDLDIDYYVDRSFISFLKSKVHFEEDGYYDPIAVIWSGIIAKQRIADFLPYEYLPGN
jgi:hypothetical protein